MADPPVHVHKTVLMQRLLDAVSRGYTWYTAGTVPVSKAQRLADKFAHSYGIDRNENQRSYARRQGRANARLFYFAVSVRPEVLHWWLCATPGTGQVHELETLRCACERRTRVRVPGDYELLRITRKSEKGGGSVWTWRMTRECNEQWRIRLRQACRASSAAEVRLAIGSLSRTPGYSGVRQQVGHLIEFARREWRRRHGSLTDFPGLIKLGYVERLRDSSVPLKQILRPAAP